MEEDEKEGQEEGSSRAGAQGPGLRYSLFSQNEDLIDKLKLLNYEEEYVSSSSSHRPISRLVNYPLFKDKKLLLATLTVFFF